MAISLLARRLLFRLLGSPRAARWLPECVRANMFLDWRLPDQPAAQLICYIENPDAEVGIEMLLDGQRVTWSLPKGKLRFTRVPLVDEVYRFVPAEAVKVYRCHVCAAA